MAATAQIKVNGVIGTNDDFAINTLATLTNDDDTDVTTWKWEFLSQPAGATDSITGATSATATATPRKEGGYLLRLTVNESLVDESIDEQVIRIRQIKSRRSVPAAGEKTQGSASLGWAYVANPMLAALDDAVGDPGAQYGVAGENLAHLDVVRPAGTAVIKSGLPGEENLPEFTKALATTVAHMRGTLYYVDRAPDGDTSPESGDVFTARAWGLIAGLTGSPSVGDPVYVSDAGALALSAGTNKRPVATVVESGGGLYDAWFDGAGTAGEGEVDIVAAPFLTDGAVSGLDGEKNVQALAATIAFRPAADGTTPLAARQFSGTQSANLLELRDSGGSPLSFFGPAGALSVLADTDATTSLGRAKFFPYSASDNMVLGHVDSGVASYALRQDASFNTVLNVATGRTLIFAINDASVGTIAAAAVNLLGDVEATVSLGRGKILPYTSSDQLVLGHFDCTTSSYALRQTAGGITVVNCASGENVHFAVNDAAHVSLAANVLYSTSDGSSGLGQSGNKWKDLWLANTTPGTAGQVGMNTTTGRPRAYIGGASHELAHVDEITPALWAYKSSDESVTSSSLQDDDALSVSLAATTTYAFRFVIFGNLAGATEGIKFAVGGSAGVSALKAQIELWDDTTGLLVNSGRVTAFDSAIGFTILAADNVYGSIEGTIVTSTAGTLKLRWAQNATGGDNTTVQAGSYMLVSKLA